MEKEVKRSLSVRAIVNGHTTFYALKGGETISYAIQNLDINDFVEKMIEIYPEIAIEVYNFKRMDCIGTPPESFNTSIMDPGARFLLIDSIAKKVREKRMV